MALQDALLSLWDRLTAAFRTVASGAAVADPAAAPAALRQQPRAVSASPNDVFTPTRPRAGRKTLVGRQVELGRILDGLLDDNAHVVLYSERGRGKTSLSNLTMEQLRRRGVIVARCACEAETAFDTMVRALVRDLPASLLLSGPADEAGEGCEGLLPHRAIRPADVAAIPESLASDRTVFVVDEFDRVLDLETRTRLADTIKLLSDRGSKLSFMVVGVSDTLEQIIGQHPSIQRNIVGVHLPLLAPDEIETMLVRGGQQAGIAFTPLAVRIVRGVARGMPYMAQLLGLRIAQAALRRAEMGDGPVPVEPADIKVAVDRLVDEASSGVVATYNALVAGAAEPRVGQVLTRLAAAQQDKWGRMTVVRAGLQVIVGNCRLSAAQWQRLLDMGVLVQPNDDAGIAQFSDRALIYHVLLLAAQRELADGPAAGKPASAGEPAAVGGSWSDQALRDAALARVSGS